MSAPRKSLDGALKRFRVMAFATGVVLICGTVALILKDAVGLKHMEPTTGILWVLHGYLFLVYVVTALQLGLKARWHLIRVVLVAAAGTIPTMSFVAEHFVTRHVRAQQAAQAQTLAAAGASEPAV